MELRTIIAKGGILMASSAILFAPYAVVLKSPVTVATQSVQAVGARTVTSPFLYTFGSDGVLNETGSMGESSSPYFWLNSGGQILFKDGTGKTIQGALSLGSLWQTLYKVANSLDTGGGLYPQNLFRLLTRSTWENVAEEVRFKVAKTNVTNTPNRDSYSGILLMSRYRDSANLYYAGIRHDGQAVIKKKAGGSYTTLATGKVFSGTYNKTTNPNLIPQNKWMKLKSETKTLADGKVSINLYLDKDDSGVWSKILSATDTGAGGGTVKGPAYAGIRTDYMDVVFDNYKLTKI